MIIKRLLRSQCPGESILTLPHPGRPSGEWHCRRQTLLRVQCSCTRRRIDLAVVRVREYRPVERSPRKKGNRVTNKFRPLRLGSVYISWECVVSSLISGVLPCDCVTVRVVISPVISWPSLYYNHYHLAGPACVVIQVTFYLHF